MKKCISISVAACWQLHSRLTAYPRSLQKKFEIYS